MITWTEFERHQPALARAGRGQYYQFGIGLAFLATIRLDGGPRVHPVCPVIGPAGLHLLIKAALPTRSAGSPRTPALAPPICVSSAANL